MLVRLISIISIIAVVGCVIFPATALASGSSSVVISELQTGTQSSSGQEFVELYNPTNSDISLSGWSLEYKSATSTDTATNWKKYATLNGVIKADGFYLISNYLQADTALSNSGLSGTAANIRIKDDNGNVVDQLGYGSTANAAETAPAGAPAAGQSLERLPGRLNESGGNAIDSDDNAHDFIVRPTPQPQSTDSVTEMPAIGGSNDDPSSTDGSIPGETTPAQQPNYLPVQISELFIDPASPLTDAHDEFIELHNTNATEVDVTGYTLRTGSNFHDYYVLPAMVIEPDAYATFYSADTHLSLTNTGGAAQLLDPQGNMVSQTDNYPAAVSGASWALLGGSWQWTLQTTPGHENVLVAPLVATSSAAKTTVKSSAKAASPKVSKASTKKVAAAKAKKTAKPKVVKTSSKVASAPPTKQLKPTGWLIIGLIALTIGYAIYEFRFDIQNLYFRARGDRGARGSNRPPA
jgi:hypothetical protein